MIDMIDVGKVYSLGESKLEALKNISFSINEGEFVAITGPSGSGKSTLMNIIGCLDTLSSGKYILDGKDITSYNDNELSEVRNSKIGFVFQRFNLLPNLNTIENVELPLIYLGKINAKERMERTISAIEKVGLKERMSHKPSELSGGQQQRVAIARAIVTNPPVILADEPTGNLDSKTGIEVMNILKDLNKSGTTIVLVTHDINIAKQAKRIIQIIDGKIIYDGGVDSDGILANC